MKIRFLGLVVAGLLLAGGTAQAAAVLTVDGGTATTLEPPTTNATFDLTGTTGVSAGDAITVFNSLTGDPFGLSVSEEAKITFEYLGSDAAFTNTFQVSGGDVFVNKGGGAATVGDLFSTTLNGLLDFALISDGTDSAVNGGPIASPLAYAFAAISDTSVIVLFDDGGVGTDFDDLAVRITVSQVPLPPAIWLLISAILGLVSFSRIRRNGTQAA